LLREASIDLLSVLGISDNEHWHQALAKAIAAAENTREDGSYRKDAVRLLSMDRTAEYHQLLEGIIRSDDSLDLRQTALVTYNQLTPISASKFLVRNWKDLPRDLHEAAMEIFLSSSANTMILLDAVKNGIIQSTSLGWAVKEQLANNDDENIRNRSRDLIISEIESREKVYSRYLPSLNMKGDSAKGLMVFKNVCSVCHQYQGEYGKSFGPDLGSIRNREKASIMNDILNPNRSIAVNYDLWIVTDKNGKKLRGILSSATSSAITLTLLGGQHTTITRTDIKSMETAEASAMPVGLETSISKEQMANLLAFLTEER